MKDNQKEIYYITGENTESVEHSPFLEGLKKRDFEVIYMVDPLDEYVAQAVTDYEGHQLKAVTKGDALFEDEKDRLSSLQKEYKGFTTWLQKIYGKKVEKVTVGLRTTDSPAVLVTGAYGWSANMERIMKAQTFADQEKYNFMASKKTMEVNPRHPVIRELKAKSEASPDDKALEDLANLIYDSALVSSGFSIPDTKDFARRITKLVSLGLDVDPDAPIPEDDFVKTEEPTESAEAEEPDQFHEEL